MAVLKTAQTYDAYQKDAKDYVINMTKAQRKLHKKNCCYYSKHFYNYYDFDTLHEAEASGYALTHCGHCFPTDKKGQRIK